MTNIALFASGSGSNAENIIQYFKHHPKIHIQCIFCNNPNAFVIERAKKFNIPVILFSNRDLQSTQIVQEALTSNEIDVIVLAGFMRLMPSDITQQFNNKIINIHPALLPKYGGKGMYGDFVHQAVVAAGETESGITIHFVNEKYDEGQIIFQATCTILPNDTAAEVAKKVHELEYMHFPKIIEDVVLRIT